MALEIRETFRVAAPVDRVWRFLMDPAEVASCMPGASLDEVVDARTFLGTVRIRLGAISASYKGRIRFDEVDDAGRTIRAVAEGRETGGGTAKGTLTSRLSALPDGSTEVIAEASVDLTGRVVQVGRGMIQGVSAQLFKEFVARVCAKLEMPVGELAGAPPAGAHEPEERESIRLLPLMLSVIRDAIVRFFRRLLGRRVPGGPQGPSA